MFDSQIIIHKTTDYSFYSPWFPRQADNAIFSVDVTATNSTNALEVRVFTKNSEDVGDGTVVASPVLTANSSSPQRVTNTWEGSLEELVRYKFTVKGGTAGNWKQFRMLAPVWFNTVDA